MSSQKTTNLNLHKWIGTDNIKMSEFNENFDSIDTSLKQQSDKVGELNSLATTSKNNLVAAVNELKNSKGTKISGSSTFNSITGTVITHSIGHVNYTVNITPTANPNGFLGEVWVEKASYSFKVVCSGSSTIGFDYEVVA